MKRFIFFAFVWLIIFLIPSINYSQTHFTANFTGDQENPAVTTSATGTGSFTLTSKGLEFNITVEGLTFTAAHFHNGAIGVNGGVVRTITGDFTGNTASGIWTSTDSEPLTPALVTDLLAGNLYVNLHTAANPGGELRGQVLLSAGTGFASNLDGDQEVSNPPVITSATGTASLTLTEAGLEYSITVEGLTFTAAHFHNGAIGVNGGVVRTLTGDFTGNTASGIWTSTDSEPLTPALIDELLAGNIYINLHTSANPGGEIRGQVNVTAVIIPVELTSFTADVSNSAVVLNWNTATETNNSGFKIQRRAENRQWKELGFVIGSGTTTESRSYSYTDNSVKNGFYSYRLKQIDYDGSFEYSDVVDVEINSPIEFVLRQNFPNPFNPSTTITYQIPELSKVTLNVYDIIGNEIATLVNEEKQSGTYSVEFDATKLSSGIYLYRLQADNFIATKKLILLK
jgi:CHRD domain/Secretion system C-terminal sorting domain